MFWTYVLQNCKGRFYIGHTENPQTRLDNHNIVDDPQGKWTRKNGPWKLVWKESHSNRSDAIRQERHIKSMKSSKWIGENLLNRNEDSQLPDIGR